jgi:hypothetical protein
MADLLEQTMPELPVEGLFETKKLFQRKFNFLFIEISKKTNERTGIDFYIPGRSDDVSIIYFDE